MKKILSDSIANIILNVLTFLASALTIFLIPKFVGVETYSYYQLYLFYIAYVGMLNIGIPEGALLREAGKKYEQIDKKSYFWQFWILTLIELCLYSAIILMSMFIENSNYANVYIAVSICAIIMNSKWLLSFILNATGNVKTVSWIALIEKIVIIVMVIVFMFFGKLSLTYLLLTDLIGHLVSTVLTMFKCKDIVFCVNKFNKSVFNDIKENMIPGSKLLIATVSSLLILGVIRYGIEANWDIVTFGKISLTISISNILMQIVSSVANVIYPRLKHLNILQLKHVYDTLKYIIGLIVFFCFALYYPAYIILSTWLPQYSDSLRYAAILFPICFYECRTNLLCKTYLQALRKERVLMLINTLAVLLSITLTIIFGYILKNLTMIIITILIVLAIRNILLDMSVSCLIKTSVVKDTFIETIVIVCFVFLHWNFGFYGMIIYIFIFILYVLFTKKKIKKVLDLFCKYVK